METRKRVLIVGGVAGGASCAARVRRLDESAEVTIFDRGPFVSFANCGLPYFVGDVIHAEEKLLVASPELFHNRFNIDVQTHHEVVSINRQSQEIEVRNLKAAPSPTPRAGGDLPEWSHLRSGLTTPHSGSSPARAKQPALRAFAGSRGPASPSPPCRRQATNSSLAGGTSP